MAAITGARDGLDGSLSWGIAREPELSVAGFTCFPQSVYDLLQ